MADLPNEWYTVFFKTDIYSAGQDIPRSRLL